MVQHCSLIRKLSLKIQTVGISVVDKLKIVSIRSELNEKDRHQHLNLHSVCELVFYTFKCQVYTLVFRISYLILIGLLI